MFRPTASEMATTGDGMAPSERGGAGEKLCKRLFWTGDPTGVSSDQGGTSAATATVISDLEQTLKQVTSALSTSSILYCYFHPETMEKLPDEILFNIFVRLLAKQLAQMRSVSKSWNALLSHPSFVKSHLYRSICNNNDQILLLFPRFKQYSCQSPHLKPINFIKHIPTNLPMNVIGSINGLICLSEYSYRCSDIHIWNPCLSAVSTIPPSHSMPREYHYDISIRFGFHPKTDDYKLVNLVGVLNIVSEKLLLQVEVYSLRKRSWDLITQPFPSYIRNISDKDFLCVDGHDGRLHWENAKEETIVAFDLGSETFHKICLPDSILDSNHRFHKLGILSRKLCEMSWRKDGVLEVWVMEEYGVPESWVKRHEFSQFTGGLFIYGFTLRNELLVRDDDEDGQLVLYDPIANKIKMTRTRQRPDKIVEFVDSLVWI